MSEKGKFPIVKMNVSNSDPPDKGKGVRLAVYQGVGGRVGDKSAIDYNLSNLKKWAKAAAEQKAQLLLLPELFLCGYNIMPDDIENVIMTKEEAHERIAPIAKENFMAIVCPYAEKDTTISKPFDSMILVDQEGTLLRNYRKTHLWGDAEKKNWDYGYVDKPEEAFKVNEVNGINVGLLNCYEAEFPELSRILALKGAQLILIPTAADVGTFGSDGKWSEWAYPDVSKTAIPANAYNNQIFCAYSNYALWEYRPDGTTLSAVFLGNSSIADPYGQIMVSADNVETMLIADCIPDKYGPTHPYGQSDYIKDRRRDLYKALIEKMKAVLSNG